jgi:predicted small lipoprotein YifL
MRSVFRMSAIVAVLAISAGALNGCGQRGPLYLPRVPPLPQRPGDLAEPASSPAVASGASATLQGDVPDTSGQPLSLAPDDDLKSNASAPSGASAPE